MITLVIKKDTIIRSSISTHERLSVSLRFLATGRSYEYKDLKFSPIISPQAVGKIIPETCEVLYKHMLLSRTNNTLSALKVSMNVAAVSGIDRITSISPGWFPGIIGVCIRVL